MRSVSLPPWGVALAVAASAPFLVKLFGESLQKRKKAKTEAFLSKVRTAREPSAPESDATMHAETKDLGATELRRTSWHD
jgi:hypothetical protein